VSVLTQYREPTRQTIKTPTRRIWKFFVGLTKASTIRTITDGEISELKHRIKYLIRERKRTKAEQLLRHEQLRKLYNEALHEAAKMHDNAKHN